MALKAEQGQSHINDYMKKRKHQSGKLSTQNKQKRNQIPVVERKAETSEADKRIAKDIKELKQFDLDPTYGPSLDSFRIDRWYRARELGLDPPENIRLLIEQHPDDIIYTHTVWQKFGLLSVPVISND